MEYFQYNTDNALERFFSKYDPNPEPLFVLYIERAREIKAGAFTKEREEYYEQEIEKIIFPKGKKKEPVIRGGDKWDIYKLLGKTGYGDFPKKLIVNGIEKYERLFIQCVGTKEYIGNGEYELLIQPEEIDNYINHKNAFIEMRVERGGDIRTKPIKIIC